MFEWWSNLAPLNQVFYGAAGFFSLIFLWQFLSSLIGLSGGDTDFDADADIEVDAHLDVDADGLDMDHVDIDQIEAHSLEQAGESTVAFRVFSIRAILAFCTMFAWAAALYMDRGKSTAVSLTYAFVWGLAGWALVAAVLYWLRKLAETGTQNIGSCVGRSGVVYLNIPADGQGEVRMTVSGRVTILKARSADGEQIRAGTPVKAVRALDSTTVEVASAGEPAGDSEGEVSK